MKIITNNQPRELVCFHNLPESEQSDFDYIEGDDRFNPRFFKYKGAWYDSGEFIRIIERRDSYNGWAHQADNDSPLLAWDGIQTESYFSGVLIKQVAEHDYESVIVGRYYV